MSSPSSSKHGFFQRTAEQIAAAGARAEALKRLAWERGEDLAGAVVKGAREFADTQATMAQLQAAQQTRAARAAAQGVVRAVAPSMSKDIGLRPALPVEPPVHREAQQAKDVYAWPLPGRYDLNVRDPARRQGGGGFGDPRNHGAGRHQGLDITTDIGTPVHAAKPGIVVAVTPNAEGYGKLVDIRHSDGTVSRYAHLDSYDVKAGDVVEGGQVIGATGRSGNLDERADPHLHFEMRRGGVPRNPYEYFDMEKVSPPGDAAAWGRALGRPLNPTEHSRLYGDG